MKKFMKAIAFATVMCMLLSVAAFAADFEIVDSKVNVEVTGAPAGKQIAFVVSTADTVGAIATGNIKDVAQTEIEEDGTVSIELGTGGAELVNIFYGYEGVGDEAEMKTAALQVAANTTVVVNVAEILTEAEIAELAATEAGKDIVSTDTDNAGAIIAKVAFSNLGEKSVQRMIWSIRYGENQVAYAEANASLFTVLDGETQIALAFSNGNRSEGEAAIAEVEVTDLEAIVLLSDGETIFSETEDFDKLDAQKKPVAEN